MIDGFLEKIKKRFEIIDNSKKDEGLWIKVDSEDLLNFCKYVKDLGFNHLSTISVTDFIEESEFEIIYFCRSYKEGDSLVIKTRIERKKPKIDSVVDVWDEAQIHERELHELFGVKFRGNPDLSELFLENWNEKPPFRKDFDWREYVEEEYQEEKPQ